MSKGENIEFNEKQLINLYGVMFSVAYADGELDKEKLQSIYEVINTEGFCQEAKTQVQNYIVIKPNIDIHINNLKHEIEEIRFACYTNTLEVAYSDYMYSNEEELILKKIRQAFNISIKQDEKLREFIKEAKKIKDRGIDDKYAQDTLKGAMAGLGAVGIPVAGVYFSGSVIGLSAAGITSGLAALGLGLGMVPGIGVAIVIGAIIFTTLSKVFDIGGKRKKEKVLVEKERRAQQTIKNLQETINYLIDQINYLDEKAKDAQANKEAVKELTKRLNMLYSVINKKKASV